ncbi:MAG: hypothetical protein HDR71_19910 [Lachnospiraceae bacterium]|nr:hypothetical protein [Lachnospiraceae bacterium]
MIELIDGNIYSIDEKDLSQHILNELLAPEHENDVICVLKEGIRIYINAEDVRNQRIDEGCYEMLHENVFSHIYSNPHIDGVVPLLDPEGNPVALAKYYRTGYEHVYDCDTQKIDTSVFDLYECICLYGVNEYAVLMYQQCFNTYTGKIILFDPYWKYILPYLGKGPQYAEVIVTADTSVSEQEMLNKKTMSLKIFASNVANYMERCELGLFSYDEIMTLVYYFTQHETIPGRGDKKLFVLDVQCNGLGLVSMVNRFDVQCAYLISKGYIPIINITSSSGSIYSDGPGDDIWSKFFRQPIELDQENLEGVTDVTISPKACASFSGKWLMQQMTGCGAIDLMKPEYFNDRLLQHIDGYRKRILQEPEKILGVLIRGTDYVASRPKGHAVQATPEQVIEKIKELDKENWNFKSIFVATEDAQALSKMKTAFGDKVKYIDQKRFVLQKGEYIADQKGKDTWRPGDGWQYGADYLCAMLLLSECGSFIASGGCTGTWLVQKLAKDPQRQTFIFDLGLYE